MDVVDSFVTTGLGVSHTRVFVVGIHHVVMDLMKKTAVRFDEIADACVSLCVFATIWKCIVRIICKTYPFNCYIYIQYHLLVLSLPM